MAEDNFLSAANLKALLSDSAPLVIMAAGMTTIILLGSIDLSMGAACSVANVITVKIINDLGVKLDSGPLTAIVALLAILIFGAFSGFLLGLVHVKFKVPSFIASLGFMSLWQSVALLITDAPKAITKVMWGTSTWFKISFGVVGLPLILALIWVVFIYVLQTKTTLGKEVFAIGGNERCGRMSGISVDRAKLLAFIINGICAALGGFFLAAKTEKFGTNSGKPFYFAYCSICSTWWNLT